AQFVGKDGSAIQTAGAPTFGISANGGNEVGPVHIAQGRRPTGPGQVAMDVGTARRNGFRVGDEVKVLLTGAAKQFRIVGLFRLGNQGDFGAVTFAAFDPDTAQRVLGAEGLYDAVFVRAAPGTPTAQVRRNVQRALNQGEVFDR